VLLSLYAYEHWSVKAFYDDFAAENLTGPVWPPQVKLGCRRQRHWRIDDAAVFFREHAIQQARQPAR
jgi:hypothetical protein